MSSSKPKEFLRELKVAQGAGLQVDTINSVIRNVSIITGDVPCGGHVAKVDRATGKVLDPTPLWTDAVLLSQVLEACERRPSGKVPVRLDHGSGFKDQTGYVTNFRLEGGRLRGDLQLMTAHEKTPLVLEMAEKMPAEMGLSISFSEHEPEKSADGTKAFARCKEVMFADLVSRPAANPTGMFSEGEVESHGGEGASGPRHSAHRALKQENPQQTIMAKTKEEDGAETPEEKIARLEAENAKLQKDLQEEQEAGAELAKALEERGGGDDDPDPDDDPKDEPGGGGDGEGAITEGEAKEFRAFLKWTREFREEFEIMREFVAEELEARDLAAHEEEARDLSTVQETLRNLAEENQKLRAQKDAAERALTGAGAEGAAVFITDHSRSLTEGSEHPFAVRKRQLEAEGLSPAMATQKARAELPREFSDWSNRRRQGEKI